MGAIRQLRGTLAPRVKAKGTSGIVHAVTGLGVVSGEGGVGAGAGIGCGTSVGGLEGGTIGSVAGCGSELVKVVMVQSEFVWGRARKGVRHQKGIGIPSWPASLLLVGVRNKRGTTAGISAMRIIGGAASC